MLGEIKRERSKKGNGWFEERRDKYQSIQQTSIRIRARPIDRNEIWPLAEQMVNFTLSADFFKGENPEFFVNG